MFVRFREILNSNGFQIEEDLDVIKVVVPYVEKDDSDEENLDGLMLALKLDDNSNNSFSKLKLDSKDLNKALKYAKGFSFPCW